MPKHIRRHTAVYLYFLILVIAMTYPLVRVFSTRLAGDAFSDAYEYVHHIWWMKHALLNGEPLFWQPLLAYPDGLNGAWLWGNPLQSFPAWLFALVMPLPAAYNAALLLALSLNGWAMYYLCWRLLRSRPAAVLGGTVFALYPAIQGHLIASHIGLVTLWGVPLYIAALLQLETSPRRRDVLWAAFLFVVSILGNNLLLIYVLFPVTVWLVGARLLRREWAWLRRMLYAVVLGGVLALVFVLPVALEQVNSPVQLDDSQVRYSADVLAVAAPSFYNPLFSDLEYSRNVLGEVKNVEGTGYIGLVAGVLSLVALVSSAGRAWLGRDGAVNVGAIARAVVEG